ncbi:MAG: DUF445 family protein [Longimicrobiales bacterium]|nr:DUF445 family protein [Longimicrobiales bacterium]
MSEVLRALLTVGFGALAGGITNTLAIWMLFHPYRPPKIGRWRLSFLQGAVPKNQPRLAAAIGRTVGGKLLTEEDLTRAFRKPEFRRAFDDRLAAFLSAVLHEERGSLRELLPESVFAEIEAIADEAVDRGIDRFEAFIDSPDFDDFLARRARDIVGAVEDEPVAGILTPAREAGLTSAVDEWLERAVASEGVRETLDDYLERVSRRLLEPERTFEETLPLGLVGAIEQAIGSYLPVAIEHLGRLLEDPGARERFERTIHDLMHRFLRDLKFHQRVVARLVVTEDTVDRVLDTIEEEGAERLSEMLQDPAVQDAMSRAINDAIVEFLRKPVSSVLGEPDDPAVKSARDTVADWIVGMARDPATRTFVVEKLETVLAETGARTWGDVFDRLPPEKLSGWIASAARSPEARKLYREGAKGLARRLLDRPIGRPSDWLPETAPRRIEGAIGDPLWEWLQTQVPDVVERLDVGKRVEEKVLDYPTEKMEELVRRVTERELRMIIRLGYLLGAIIGCALLVVDTLVGG